MSSTMLPLGTAAPEIVLSDYEGVPWRLSDQPPAPALVVLFVCNHCPFVVHVAEELGRVCDRLTAAGALVVGVNSNDVTQVPEDGPDRMREAAAEWGWRFSYLVDADQSVAHAYRAACTPDVYVFDGERRLVYRGQLDSSRPGNGVPVTGEDLEAAVIAVLEGRPVDGDQRPSMGCNIKWKPGNEPDWFGASVS